MSAVPLHQPTLSADGRVLPFRRPPSAVKRLRRHLLVRLARPFSGALLLVGLPTASVWWLLTAPRFGLRTIAVEGGERVSAAWVKETLAPAHGYNLIQLPLETLGARLASHPWVLGVDLHKELPDRLRVRIIEKRATALLRSGSQLFYLDPAGATIDRYDPAAGPIDFLVVTRPAGVNGEPAGALELAQEIERERPDWAAGLSEIEILGERDYRITTETLPFPLLLEAGDWARRARYLETLLPQILDRYDGVAAVDLRFSRRLIVQPTVRATELRTGSDQKGLVG